MSAWTVSPENTPHSCYYESTYSNVVGLELEYGWPRRQEMTEV